LLGCQGLGIGLRCHCRQQHGGQDGQAGEGGWVNFNRFMVFYSRLNSLIPSNHYHDFAVERQGLFSQGTPACCSSTIGYNSRFFMTRHRTEILSMEFDQ